MAKVAYYPGCALEGSGGPYDRFHPRTGEEPRSGNGNATRLELLWRDGGEKRSPNAANLYVCPQHGDCQRANGLRPR